MRVLYWLCLGGAALARAAEIEPALEVGTSLSQATVTIPYVELKSLWEAARARPVPEALANPISAVLLSAEHTLKTGDQEVVLEGRYRVRSFSQGWHTVPLLGGDARLESAEASEGVIVWQSNRYCLMAEGEGERTVAARFVLPSLEHWGQDGTVLLMPGEASLSRLAIHGDFGGKQVRIEGMRPVQRAAEEAVYQLAAGHRELTLIVEEEQAAPVPSVFDGHSEVRVRFEEGRLNYECRVHVQAEGGSGLGMDLWVPRNALMVEVSGDDLRGKRLGAREDGWRLLRLEWQTEDILERAFTLSYQVPQSTLATNWTLQGPRAGGGGSSRTLFAIGRVPGLELQSARGAVSGRRVPEWMGATVRDLLVEGEFEEVLQAVWLPLVETVQATASRAEYKTRLVSDGSQLVEGDYTVQHQGPVTWRIHLPGAEEILTCHVDGKPVQPVRRGPNELEFMLPGGESPLGQSNRVGFRYAARGVALDRVSGQMELRLPRADLFVHELLWQVVLPESYETTAVEGNLEMVRSTGGEPGRRHVIQFRKELVREEGPIVEVFYRRQGLEE